MCCATLIVSSQAVGDNMWTEITRRKYERAVPRYASNLSDAEWALIEPFMPVRKLLGRPRETDLRAVLDAILYIARSGCQWRMLPKDFPPFTTVQGYFYEWRDTGLFERINFELLVRSSAVSSRIERIGPLGRRVMIPAARHPSRGDSHSVAAITCTKLR